MWGRGWWMVVGALSIGLGLGAPVHAQVKKPTVVFDDAQIFHPATDPSRFVSVYDTRNLEPGQYTLGLYGTFANNPLILDLERSETRSSALVRTSVGADLIAALGITDRIQLGVDVPYVYTNAKRVLNLGIDTDDGGHFLGDISVEGKFTLLPRPVGEGFGLSILPRIIVPTGNRKNYAGSQRLGGGGLLIADWRYNKINYGFNVGGIYRDSKNVDDQLLFGGGVTVPVVKHLDVIGEINGLYGLRGERDFPLEGLLSLRFHWGSLAFTIGGGAGITHGRGAAEYRVIGGITPYIPEKEIAPPRADLVTNSRKTWVLANDVDKDGRPNPGDTVEYTINLVNTGTAAAEEVVFADAIPEHTSYVPGTMTMNGTALTDGAGDDAGDYNVSNPGAVTVKVGTIGIEQGSNSVTFTFRVMIDPELVDLTVIRNEAVVSLKNVIPPEAEEELPLRLEERLPVAETTVFPRVRERETVVVTPEKLELTRNIHFEFNKAKIRPESFTILNDVAAVLKDNPQLNILIEGHTDSVGSVEYNQKLSDRRAASVRQYLIERGVSAARLATKGRGKLAPIASNDTAVGRAMNRRVEFLIVNPEVLKGKTVEKRSFVEDITPESEPASLESRLPAGARQKGDRETAEAQAALRKIGYLSEEPTGIITPGTRAALEKFQKDNGLPVTGQLDAITRKALDEAVELAPSR